MNDFIIDQVSWHTQVRGDAQEPEVVYRRFRALAEFLQQNDLCTRPLLDVGAEVDETFVLRRSDLTERGFSLVQSAYEKWVRKIDRGGTPEDVSILSRQLAKTV